MRCFISTLGLALCLGISAARGQTPSSAVDRAAGAEAAAPASAPARKAREVKIGMRDGLRFDPARFAATPGELLRLRIENADTTDLAHNLLVLAPGTRDSVNAAAMLLAAQTGGVELAPKNAGVLAATRLVQADEVTYLEFELPPEPGVYPYLCTFPGHGTVMYGAIYSGVPMPEAEADPNIPRLAVEKMIAGGGKRPFLQRVFMPDAGPAAIAVALPGNQNYCWDAGECRLRYVWRGAFIDASEQWRGNGNVLARIPERPWWNAGKGHFPLRIGRLDGERPVVRFLGYSWENGLPAFRYQVAGANVTERIAARSDGLIGLDIHLAIDSGSQPVFYDAGRSSGVRWGSTVGAWRDNVLTLRPDEAKDVTIGVLLEICVTNLAAPNPAPAPAK